MSASADAGPPLRVLCVGGYPDYADSAAHVLRVMGFEARACYDGEPALLLNDSFRPGVCFIDLAGPPMDGGEVAARLRQGGGWRPLLLVAVTALDDRRPAAFDMRLAKPLDPAQLIAVVDALFRAAEAAGRVARAARAP